MNCKLIISSALLLVLFFVAPAVNAEDMSSTNYRIIFGTLNSGGNRTSSANYRVDVSLGQVAASQFNSTNYVVRAGFQYIRTLYPFAFRLNTTAIPLGTLIPNTPSTGAVNATVSTRSQGYDVYVLLDTPLTRILSVETIPDTSCDGGVDTCTLTLAKPWTSTSAYGFGYNVNGNDAATDFINTTYFRPFPAASQSEAAGTAMTTMYAGRNRTATITAKANIDALQPAGTYQTVIRFIAVPKY